MPQSLGTFPFGLPIERVLQSDRNAKRVFVLGVYASAVHARLMNSNGKQVVRALAVASEPYIFWKGEGADGVISKIRIPKEAGRLVSAGCHLNGPSGRSIDESYLNPLGLAREDAWLCDIVPYSCMNPGQAKAVKNHYGPLVEKFGLPPVKWSRVPTKLADDARRAEIAAELRQSDAEVVITLGDQPLRWFTSTYGSKERLSTHGTSAETYGRLQAIEIEGRSKLLLPLVHPRQAARLGGHDRDWANLHSGWARDVAPSLLP